MVLLKEENPSWKGEKVSYTGLHRWVSRNKPKPSSCEYCDKAIKLMLANISGKYTRDLSDWVWCCYKCHRLKHRLGEHQKPKRYVEHLKYEVPREHKKYEKQIKAYQKKYTKKWRRENKDYIKKYEQDNKEHILNNKRLDRLNNPKKHKKWRDDNYKRNRKKIIVSQILYAQMRAIIREKYKPEFDEILKRLMDESMDKNNNIYKRNYFRAEKILKNNHKEEYSSFLRK